MAVEHDTNRVPKPEVFTNDFSSKNEMEAKKRERDTHAAAEREKELAVDRARQEKEANEAATALQLHNLQDALRNTQNELQNEKTRRQNEVSSRDTIIQDLRTQNVNQAAITESLTRQYNESVALQLVRNNNLDPSLSGKTVFIINCESRTAMDGGRDDGSTAHGIVHDYGNGWQPWRVIKANGNDRHSAWLVQNVNNGRYMEFQDSGNDKDVKLSGRRTDYQGSRTQEWLIGLVDSGKYMFQNVHYDTVIDLSSTTVNAQAIRLRSYSRNEVDKCQLFGILRIAFND